MIPHGKSLSYCGLGCVLADASSAALLIAPTASAKDLKAARFGHRCWQPPVHSALEPLPA